MCQSSMMASVHSLCTWYGTYELLSVTMVIKDFDGVSYCAGIAI